MSWYFVLLAVSFSTIFIFAFLSWALGDFDFDIDGDADLDSDGSTMFSYKGCVHFIFGFSMSLCMFATYIEHKTIQETAHFTWWEYGLSILGGFLMMYILYKLYKLIIKAEHHSDDNKIPDGSYSKLMTNLGNHEYEVMVYTPSGTRKIKAYYHDSDTEEITGFPDFYVMFDDEKNIYVLYKNFV